MSTPTGLLLILGIVTFALPGQTQSIIPASDGTGTIINHNGNTYNIDGGTQAGANLFHSFQEFGLNPHEIANFLSRPNIQNILGRVIGNNPSVIEGLIRLTGGNSNLYLMNPNGIIFGQGASLDVPASFIATSATSIGFNGGEFKAYGTNNYNQLIGAPNSFIFDRNTGLIFNQGHLTVKPEHNLWLIGGSVISTGTVQAPGGNITIAAIPGKNEIKISQDGMLLSLILEATPIDGNSLDSSQELGLRAKDLPLYLTGSSPLDVNNGEVVVNQLQGSTVTLMGRTVQPTNPNLIAANSGSQTVVLFGTNPLAPLTLNVIDTSVKGYEQFLYGGLPGSISIGIGRQENGIEKVSTILNSEALSHNVDAINIIAEGNAGNFWLGNAFISNENVEQYSQQLQSWRNGLTASADILLYSCLTGLGEVGNSLLQALAIETGADVAASTNITGSGNHGGDWLLENQLGMIKAESGFKLGVFENYGGKLQIFTASDAGTLATAITSANGTLGADEIRFAPGVTLINLTATLPTITDILTITGGGTNVTIQGNNTFRIFDVGAVATTFDFLTITGGNAGAGNGGGINSGGAVTVSNSNFSNNSGVLGGGINNTNGAVTVSNSTFTGNRGSFVGGGIFSFNSPIIVSNSTFTENSAGGFGGALDNNGPITIDNSIFTRNTAPTGGVTNTGGAVTINNSILSNNSAIGGDAGAIRGSNVTINNSTISNNFASGFGGGIDSFATVIVTNSTINNNLASRGGGMRSGGVVTITNSTISGNSASIDGGGILANSGGTISNSTITNNVADSDSNNIGNGGGIFRNGGTFTITNSIIAGNTDRGGQAPDLAGSFLGSTLNFNLIGSTAGPTNLTLGTGNIINPNPGLLPLGNYGGPTQTHALALTSPALNAGSNALTTVTTDQRGAPGVRIANGTVDMGAFEFQGFEIVPLAALTQTVTGLPATFDVSVKVVEKVFNVIPSVGTPVNYSLLGGVTGTFSNGLTVLTDALGIVRNFFTTQQEGSFSVLASSPGLSSVMFNLKALVVPVPVPVSVPVPVLEQQRQRFEWLGCRGEFYLDPSAGRRPPSVLPWEDRVNGINSRNWNDLPLFLGLNWRASCVCPSRSEFYLTREQVNGIIYPPSDYLGKVGADGGCGVVTEEDGQTKN